LISRSHEQQAKLIKTVKLVTKENVIMRQRLISVAELYMPLIRLIAHTRGSEDKYDELIHCVMGLDSESDQITTERVEAAFRLLEKSANPTTMVTVKLLESLQEVIRDMKVCSSTMEDTFDNLPSDGHHKADNPQRVFPDLSSLKHVLDDPSSDIYE
jgi:hypothetical protein